MKTSKITELTEKEPTLEELQEIVGGYIQIVTSKDGTADIIMDEEGKLKGKEINMDATELWLGKERARNVLNFDVIVGDVAVCRGKARLT